MPAALKYVDPTKGERSDFNPALQKERKDRTEIYRSGLRYFYGYHDNPDGSSIASYDDLQGRGPRDDRDEDEPDDTTYINMVRMMVDRTASFLFAEMPTIEIDATLVEQTDEEKWLERCLEENGGLELFIKTAQRGCLSGHNFLRIKPVPKEFENRSEEFPTITVLDPTSIIIYWAADDTAKVLWYEYKYGHGNDVIIEDIVAQPNGTWMIYTYTSKDATPYLVAELPTHHGSAGMMSYDYIDYDKAHFVKTNEQEHTSRIPPIIEWVHQPDPDDRYGLQEFSYSLKHLQDSLNKMATQRATIIRENSGPVDVATGVDAGEVEANAARGDGLVVFASEKARVQRLEMKSDLAGINETIKSMMETFLAIARVVLLKGDAKDLQRVTNASVRTLFLDMLSKNSILQSSYGRGIKRMVKLLLEMGFEQKAIKNNPVKLDPKVKFGSPLPIDLSEIAANAQIMNGMGSMSKQTAATQYGLDWAFEDAAIKAEFEQGLEQQKAAMELLPDQEIGPDGKPTGKPSAEIQHKMSLEQTAAKGAAKPVKPGLDKKKKVG